MIGWWLVRGLYYPSYIGDSNKGNPYKPTSMSWNDRGILNTAQCFFCVWQLDDANIVYKVLGQPSG